MEGRNEKKQLCRFLGTSRGCFRGEDFRFSHNLSDPSAILPKPRMQDDPFQVWARNVPKNIDYCYPLGPKLSKMFITALSLVRQNHSYSQGVISRLATEFGFKRIGEVCLNIQRDSTSVFQSQLLPFLQLLCEDQVRNSFILEKDVSTIYNYLYGPNGSRGAAMYTYVLKVFPGFCLEKTVNLTADSLNVLSISFDNLIELNSSSVLVDELKMACKELLSFLSNLDEYRHLLQPDEFGIRSLLERQFRLLREDTVGQFRDAVKQLFDTDKADKSQSARTIIYNNASLVHVSFDKSRGLDMLYEFEQPKEVQNFNANKRFDWWKNTRRLQSGAFICLLDVNGNPVFASVSQTGLERDQTCRVQAKTEDPEYTIFHDANFAYITLTLVDTTPNSVRTNLK